MSVPPPPKTSLVIDGPAGSLEALLEDPGADGRHFAVVCHPHPLHGGTMHNKVVFRAAAGLVDAGLTTLRFNFRGVGASTGVHNEIEGGVEDVNEALNYLKADFPYEDITLAGFSFGSRTGMEVGVADDDVRRLISIGTPVEKYNDYDFLADVKKPILFVHGDEDEFCSVAGLRSLTDRIPQADVVIFENCGHFFDDDLEKLRATIRDWTGKQLSNK